MVELQDASDTPLAAPGLWHPDPLQEELKMGNTCVAKLTCMSLPPPPFSSMSVIGPTMDPLSESELHPVMRTAARKMEARIRMMGSDKEFWRSASFSLKQLQSVSGLADLSVRFLHRHGERHAEGGLSGFRTEGEATAMLVDDDRIAGMETQLRTASRRFGREERVEDAILNVRRDSWTGILDFNSDPSILGRAADFQAAASVHCGNGIVDQIGPDLIQLAPERLNLR